MSSEGTYVGDGRAPPRIRQSCIRGAQGGMGKNDNQTIPAHTAMMRQIRTIESAGLKLREMIYLVCREKAGCIRGSNCPGGSAGGTQFSGPGRLRNCAARRPPTIHRAIEHVTPKMKASEV